MKNARRRRCLRASSAASGCSRPRDAGRGLPGDPRQPAPSACRACRSCSTDRWRCRHAAGTCPTPRCTSVHQRDQVLHDHVDAILVEVAMVAEAEQVQLQALALHHAHVGHVGDVDSGEVGLAGDRAQRRELRAVELHEVVVAGCLFSNVSSTPGS